MRIAFIALALISASTLAQAGGNGDHPAIAARRVIAAQGYDYSSAFYLHPARLSLATEAPVATANNRPDSKHTGERRPVALPAASGR
jgi:hypothetical protein